MLFSVGPPPGTLAAETSCFLGARSHPALPSLSMVVNRVMLSRVLDRADQFPSPPCGARGPGLQNGLHSRGNPGPSRLLRTWCLETANISRFPSPQKNKIGGLIQSLSFFPLLLACWQVVPGIKGLNYKLTLNGQMESSHPRLLLSLFCGLSCLETQLANAHTRPCLP